MSENMISNVLATGLGDSKDPDPPAVPLHGGRKQLAIPKLDENQLNLKRQEGAGGGGNTFSVAEVLAPTAEGSSAPLNSNAPAFILPVRSPYANGSLAVDSPTANAAYLAFLQQQSLQYPIQQTCPPEQELFMTQSILQQCPRSILLMVLSSLLDENPRLAAVIKQRCEKAAAFLAQQQHQAAAAGRFAQHMGNAPWTAQNNAPSNYESPRASVYVGSGSPHAGSTRKGRGAKNREEGMCSVHNSMRSMNHLQMNKQNGQYECVHGFHCLEDGGSTVMSPNHLLTPGSPTTVNAHGDVLPVKHTNHSVRQPRQSKDQAGSNNNNGNSRRASSHSNSGGVTPPQELCSDQTSTKDGSSHRFGVELDMLKNILQSVREMEAKEN